MEDTHKILVVFDVVFFGFFFRKPFKRIWHREEQTFPFANMQLPCLPVADTHSKGTALQLLAGFLSGESFLPPACNSL